MAKMTIAQCENAALQLLNQYSITGTTIPLTYNDQADTKLRMRNLINDAQMEIAKTVKPIHGYFEYEVAENPTVDEYEIDLEEQSSLSSVNLSHISKVYFKTTQHGQLRTIDAQRYKIIDDTIIILPSRPAGTYKIEYARFPERYDEDTAGTTVLDNTSDTHEAIPYYVAAMLATDENPKAHYELYNVWETRLSRLGEKPAHAVFQDVDDVYGFNNFGGIY